MSETTNTTNGFVERRLPQGVSVPSVIERRQFSNSHAELSPKARQLAMAIDEYKLRHRRRFINCDELLGVIEELGYQQVEQ